MDESNNSEGTASMPASVGGEEKTMEINHDDDRSETGDDDGDGDGGGDGTVSGHDEDEKDEDSRALSEADSRTGSAVEDLSASGRGEDDDDVDVEDQESKALDEEGSNAVDDENMQDDDDDEDEDTEPKKHKDDEDQDDVDDQSGHHADGDDEREESDDDSEEEENLEETLKQHRNPILKRERYHVPKIFQDAITVLIPLDVTADLRVAVKHTRDKRIRSIYKHFPALEKTVKKRNYKSDSDAMTGEDEDENAKEKEDKKNAKRKKLEHVPQPEQFGSVLDYLEAKYVKGVMLDEDEEDGPNLDDQSEGQGSVYSKDSFLDDTDLQRDVAEQVMASTTLTKLELEQEDGDFFVNIGHLEVENDDYGENYDPLQDKENPKTKKKRKKPTAPAATTPASTVASPKKTKTDTAKEEVPGSAKSTKSKKSTASAKSTTTSKSKNTTATPKSEKESEGTAELRKAVKRMKARLDTLHKKGVVMIKEMTDEDLPKRKTKLKVALTCPPKKKPGDDITFTNPHNPTQRLRVKVPKDCGPGSTFKVTVPVKYSAEEEEKDHNKFSRAFKDFLDDYARAHDDWLAAKHEINPDINIWKEKQNKFEKLAPEFPKNLMTPVDSSYLKTILRKGRQSKYKRKKPDTEVKGEETKVKEEKQEKKPPQTRIIDIPGMGKTFPTVKWTENDFV